MSLTYYTFSALNKLNIREVYGYNIGSIIHMDPGAKVTEGIYIGSLATATSDHYLKSMNIGAIINLSGTDYNTDIPVLNIVMDDINVTPYTMDFYMSKFSHGVEAITLARCNNKNVLIHCAAGINRSATLIAFYLIDCGWTFKQAVMALAEANNKRNVPLLTNDSFKYLLQARDSFKRNFDKKQN